MNKQAVIVLHEIYGINKFIEDICRKLNRVGFDVFCPDMIGRPPFLYKESKKAYDHFIKYAGFDVYKQISNTVNHLKETYEKVFILGFSVGATVAWRCCENSLCDGIVGCYGSRIRDYTDLTPVCPTFLLFAKEDFFDVDSLICQLKGKPNLMNLEFDAKHGFIDSFSKCFNPEVAKDAEKSIFCFFSEYGLREQSRQCKRSNPDLYPI